MLNFRCKITSVVVDNSAPSALTKFPKFLIFAWFTYLNKKIIIFLDHTSQFFFSHLNPQFSLKNLLTSHVSLT